MSPPDTRPADEAVFVSCVRHSYEDGTEVQLCGLDFVAERGKRVAVLGPNGSGKTTLLFHILGLLKAQEGVVRVFGVDPAADWKTIRRRIGVVLQNVEEQILAPTVAEDVGWSPRQYGLPEGEIERRVAEALGLLGIEKLAARVPQNLSGGEKRKVALAGAIVMDPELLVMDEPFEGLDPRSRSELIGLINRLSAERGTTVIMSTHDIDTVPEVADYAYVLEPGGHIVLEGTPAEIFAKPERLEAGNIRPPILAELFARLRRIDPSVPTAALTVEEAAEELARWKRDDSRDDAPSEGTAELRHVDLGHLAEAVEALRDLPPGAVPHADTLRMMCEAWGNPTFQAGEEYLREIAVRAANADAILECGSGLTTILLAAVAGERGIPVISLEHNESWASLVSDVLDHAGLRGVTLVAGPLVDHDGFHWYRVPEALPERISLVVCDGPPGSTYGGRYGLAPLMKSRFTADTIILVHDAEREDERRILRRWQDEFGFVTTDVVPEAGGREYAVVRVGG
jgi:cobalt/nickel transport system ATP-binding protein